MNQLVGPLKGRGRKKKKILERETNIGTSVKTRVAIDTEAELKRKVDQKSENLMVNIQKQISAVPEHIATIVDMIKHEYGE